VRLPGARRSGHPDASVVAIGHAAEEVTANHPLTSGYGPGSPMERLIALGGKVLLLGVPPSTVTVLHYAEAEAPIAGKRRVTTEMPVLNGDGNKVWCRVEDFDSNGILDCYAVEEEADAVERIAWDYLALGRHRPGRVGRAASLLIDARDIVEFGVAWLIERHG
jgi:aminoglycoside N3'-acetyltransferase